MSGNIYTLPPGVPFLPSLAEGLQERLGERLSEALILLPTRRAVRELGDIFVGETGAKILPRMRPLADIDPDEPPFEPGFLSAQVQPSMPSARRRFELANLVGRYHLASGDEVDPAAMLALADPLISVLDDAAMEEVSAENLAKLTDIRDLVPEHFKNAAVFYEILQTHWPKHLEAAGVSEPMARRVALLNALADHWQETPPDHPVIIAGSTGTLGATSRLIRLVTTFEDGLIILPGLDTAMPEAAWAQIRLQDRFISGTDIVEKATPEHPQISLKNLLSVLEKDRKDILIWGQDGDGTNPRRALISEALVPADSTADWPERIETLIANSSENKFFEKALDGISVLEARTDDEEAMAIALILRETVDDPEKTAALVTPDPNLARRVKARLRRWNVNVDYSQGEPLEETLTGSFLASILLLAQDPENLRDMAALFKHALCAIGQPPGEVRAHWMFLERRRFRRDLEDVGKGFADDKLHDWLKVIAPLTDDAKRLGTEWGRLLAEVAEALARTDELPGAKKLWREDAGEKAAALLEDIMAHSDAMGEMDLADFFKMFGLLMRGRVVRPRFGTHPRLRILGPLEARMLTADTIILGGLNEGVWPAKPKARPFLSRGMRRELGLSLPERRLGLAAHDFQQLAANRRVFLTRAKRSEDGPRVASRWLWRLQTLVKGALKEEAAKALEPDQPYLKWAQVIDAAKPGQVTPAKRPRPSPPKNKRWPKGRQLSVTQIKTWIRDPYAIYGRHVLGLRRLRELGYYAGPREYGNALHSAIEKFTKHHGRQLTPASEDILTGLLRSSFLEYGFEELYLAREGVRLERISKDLTEWMGARLDRRSAGIWAEISGKWKIDGLDKDFVLTGKPDLIELGAEGYTIIDYKTGAPPSAKVVKAGFDPQLPLLGAMVKNSAFLSSKLRPEDPIDDLLYVRIKGSGSKEKLGKSLTGGKDAVSGPEFVIRAEDDLRKLIASYDDAGMPYYSQPRVQYKNDYGDYDLLARRGEWAKLADPDGGGPYV